MKLTREVLPVNKDRHLRSAIVIVCAISFACGATFGLNLTMMKREKVVNSTPSERGFWSISNPSVGDNVAMNLTASGATHNYALFADEGDVKINGNAMIGDSASDTTTITGHLVVHGDMTVIP